MTVTKNHLIFLAIYTALIAAATYFIAVRGGSDQPGVPYSQQRELDSLSREFQTLQVKQTQKDSLIAIYKTRVVALDERIDSANTEIIKIRSYYGKKIDDINKYTPTQLDSFFTNRYQ